MIHPYTHTPESHSPIAVPHSDALSGFQSGQPSPADTGINYYEQKETEEYLEEFNDWEEYKEVDSLYPRIEKVY